MTERDGLVERRVPQEFSIGRGKHDAQKAWLDGYDAAMRSAADALSAAQRDCDSHLSRANEEIALRQRIQIAYTQSEQKRLVLIDRAEQAEAKLAALLSERKS